MAASSLDDDSKPRFQSFSFFISVVLFNIIIPTAAEVLDLPLDIIDKFHSDIGSIRATAHDYGQIETRVPLGVFNPTSAEDIWSLVSYSYSKRPTIPIAARGRGHSVHGQSLTQKGIVVNMSSLSLGPNRITFTRSRQWGDYLDVGGEQLWIDVLRASLSIGLTPVSWTDYLYLTVGGTLSNAGISGQTFRFGPQISNVLELDVVTAKGILTCSEFENTDLFHAALGGLGQFGIITRARIPLVKAPNRVKWVRMLYSSFDEFTKDQVFLINNNLLDKRIRFLSYIEGLLLLDITLGDTRSFYPIADQPRISNLIATHGIIYVLEVALYYTPDSEPSAVFDLNVLLNGLKYEENFLFAKDASYEEFLNRVHVDQVFLESIGAWNVPHPWLNFFIPRQRLYSFEKDVFRGIILKNNITSANGVFIFYPMQKFKWNDKMSAVVADEDIFFTAGFLFSADVRSLGTFDGITKQILEYCKEYGLKIKQYLPNIDSYDDWVDHFGPKWQTFVDNKRKYDPFNVFAPGQRVFQR